MGRKGFYMLASWQSYPEICGHCDCCMKKQDDEDLTSVVVVLESELRGRAGIDPAVDGVLGTAAIPNASSLRERLRVAQAARQQAECS